MEDRKKTTKEILKEQSAGRPRTPLYSSEALAAIQKTFDAWQSSVVPETHRSNWRKTPHTVLGSDTPRELLYTPLSTPDLDYDQDLGNSGQAPFTRGVHASMYRGREFTMRQLTGFGSPEQTNERIRFMLDHGATGLNILFDLPSIQMYDSDDPFAVGQVACRGSAWTRWRTWTGFSRTFPFRRSPYPL